MAHRKKHTAEQVLNPLRQIEVAVANGKMTFVVCKEAKVSGQKKALGTKPRKRSS